MALDTENTTVFRFGDSWISDDGTRDLTKADDIGIIPYIWQIGIEDNVYFGRTMLELKLFLEELCRQFGGNWAIIYVHNLGYDFEFFAPLWSGWEVFARAPHKPIYARLPDLCIEFRCSYLLTNMALADAAKSLNCTNNKFVGGLNYSKLRTPLTPLKAHEMQYSERDILSLIDIINKYREKYGTIANIPLTQTGEVRREVKKLLRDKKYMTKVYNANNNYNDYVHLTRLFAGGVTHINYLYNGTILTDVWSYDRRSSYPAVMCLERYPCDKFERVPGAHMGDRKHWLYYGLLRITGLRARNAWDYISVHKCESIDGGQSDNGKLYKADALTIWITDVDYDIINQVYTYDTIEWLELYRAPSEYLDKRYINYILKLYSDKTALKNVAGREKDYAKAKQYINSLYGMSVTNNIRDEVSFDAGWQINELTTDDIRDRLAAEKPILPYSVGVWVTAYARRELFKLIISMGNNCVYCDTDSVKGINNPEWINYIIRYNNSLRDKINEVCAIRGLDSKLFFPMAPDGTICMLGEFAFDGHYAQFKSYGAKKYAYIDDKGHFDAVLAGCQKEWIEYEDDADGNTKYLAHQTIKGLNDFTKSAVYPHARKVHYYITDCPAVDCVDYCGIKYHQDAGVRGIAIQDSTYSMGLSRDYIAFLALHQGSTTNVLRDLRRAKL